MLASLKKAIIRAKKSDQGVAAIEFAIMLPFLLIIFFGTFQVATYIMATRKVDNVANDIAYLLSREGQIATGTTPTGGQAKLQSILSNVVPFLVYPYKFDPSVAGGDSQVAIKYVGLPNFATNTSQSPTTPVACNPTTIDQKTVRLMWAHRYPTNADASVQYSLPAYTSSECSTTNLSTLCPWACKDGTSAITRFNSIYSEPGYGERAAIVYPGQAYILVNFGYKFTSLLKYSGATSSILGSVLPNKIEKVASYAVRALWDDTKGTTAGVVEANELINNMHICTDCNLATSGQVATGNPNGMLSTKTTPMRQYCSATASSFSGCTF